MNKQMEKAAGFIHFENQFADKMKTGLILFEAQIDKLKAAMPANSLALSNKRKNIRTGRH